MTAAAANGITIEYDVHGESGAPPLLLVMGLGGQLVQWPQPFVERLADRGFRVIRYDNRDVGLSTKIDAPVPTRRQVVAAVAAKRYARSSYLLADMARDAVGLLDAIGVERAHVVGISMGGMISQTLAIHHPERVASLASIMSNTGDRRHGRVHRTVTAAQRPADDPRPGPPDRERPEAVPARLRPALRPRRSASDAGGLPGPQRRHGGVGPPDDGRMASPDRTWDLRRVSAPTLVVHGLLDRLVMPSGGIATVRAIPGARLVMYPDMAHDLPRPRWDELIEEIVQNTRRAGGGAAGQPARIA